MTTNKDLKPEGILVTITQEDIDNAKGFCPIWKWFEKNYPGFLVKVLRSSVQIYPYKGSKGMCAKLPPPAVAFTHAFDFGLDLEPISFYLKFTI